MTTQTQQALPTGIWRPDAVHSAIGFNVDYMAGTFSGAFSRFAATVADGEIRGSAEVESVLVKDENLEAHLQGPDFFDAERHPQLTFVSKDISRSGDDLAITGEISIKGHTETVEITGRITDPFEDPFGNERFGLRLETTIDRTQYGLKWNNPLPSGEPALSNDVQIVAELQLVKQG